MVEPVVNCHFFEPCVITVDEYERIKRDVEARVMVGATEVGDRILANVLVSMSNRYHQAKAIIKEQS